MGMYDYIIPECKLPVEVPDGIEWQTKDTPAQFLDTYRITPEGQLIHGAYTFETVPKSERDTHGLPLFRRANPHDEPCDFTGSIMFYGGDYKFCAFFVNGQLTRLV